MKRLIPTLLTAALLAFASCGNDKTDDPSDPKDPETEEPQPTPDPDPQPETPHLLRGADISWYTEMAADGMKFYTSEGVETPCPELMKEIGMEAVRLRVWVHPELAGTKYSDPDDVVTKARAAQAAGLGVMIDFHYSDTFADPGRQNVPAAWNPSSLSDLATLVADHTRTTLRALLNAGVDVQRIQIGNETRNGMLWPLGQLWNEQGDIPGGWKNFCTLVNAGYDVAKEIYPEATVMVHLNHAYEDNAWWVERFLSNGGKTDAVAFSHYPMSDDTALTWMQLNVLAKDHLHMIADKFGLPVCVSETGVNISDADLAMKVMTDFMTKMQNLWEQLEETSTPLMGVYYWEPEVYGGWKPSWYQALGWGSYDQGAFLPDGRPSPVLLQGFLGD